jgi:hypothetical protein
MLAFPDSASGTAIFRDNSTPVTLVNGLINCRAMVLVNNKDRAMRHPRGFTSRHRAYLAKKVDQLDRLEVRNTITEPILVLS